MTTFGVSKIAEGQYRVLGTDEVYTTLLEALRRAGALNAEQLPERKATKGRKQQRERVKEAW